MTRWADQRLSLATHEAGHAVCAAVLGIDVRLVTILPDVGSNGRVELPHAEQGTLAARAMVRIAGRQACRAWRVDGGGCLKDFDEARAYALVATDGDEARADALVEEWTMKVDDLLFRYAPSVGEVSIQLLERDSLSGEELTEIVSSSEVWPSLNPDTRKPTASPNLQGAPA